jgi:hypothetical protein
MLQYIRQYGDEQRDLIYERIGEEGRLLLKNGLVRKSLWSRFSTIAVVQRLQELCLLGVAGVVGGRRLIRVVKEAIFRQQGEIHRWMYDSYGLSRLLGEGGFIDIRACKADESKIPEFKLYGLEKINGVERKPDSLYMEAQKSAGD